MRTINWRHFAHAKCEACYHPEKVKVGVLCSEHQARAQGYVYGFEAAAKLAVQPSIMYLFNTKPVWVVTAPGGLRLCEGVWSRTVFKPFDNFSTSGAAREAAMRVAWWPLQPWEVET